MKKLDQETFNRILCEIVNEDPASHLFLIPGVYEPVAEFYNNDVLRQWEEEQETEEDLYG